MIFGLLILHPFSCKSSSISVPFTSSAARNINVISAFACVDCWSTKRREVCPSQQLFFDLQPPTSTFKVRSLTSQMSPVSFLLGKKDSKSPFPQYSVLKHIVQWTYSYTHYVDMKILQNILPITERGNNSYFSPNSYDMKWQSFVDFWKRHLQSTVYGQLLSFHKLL